MAFDSRHSMTPDGLSYLDMAAGTLQSGPENLVNGYWSPFYPLLIALTLALVNPSPELEFPTVQFLNWLLFTGVVLCFGFFLRSWLSTEEGRPPSRQGAVRDTFVVPFAFGLFIWSISQLAPLQTCTPDLPVAGIVFLAAGLCCRPASGVSANRNAAALGLVLSAGYYMKAAMLPIGGLLLAILFCRPPKAIRRKTVLLAGMVFALACTPLVVLLSQRAGRLSFGETGWLNYAWYVNNLHPHTGWFWDSGLSGTPENPPATLIAEPLIHVFPEPVKGTYPLWYEPSYWYRGARARFDLRQQIGALQESLKIYGGILVTMSALCAGVVVLATLGGRRRTAGILVWPVAWPLAAFVLYALVHVEDRFLAGFAVLFWLAAYRVVLGRAGWRVDRAALLIVLCSLQLPVALQVVQVVDDILVEMLSGSRPDYLLVAGSLRELGVKRGDKLAVVGYAGDAYYARASGTRVVAQAPDADSFWTLDAGGAATVRARLASAGVKAIVARDKPAALGQPGWLEVPGVRYHRYGILLLQPPGHQTCLPPHGTLSFAGSVRPSPRSLASSPSHDR